MTVKNLRELRQGYGLSQEAAAKTIGVHVNTWRRWELGRIRTTRDINGELKSALGFSVTDTGKQRAPVHQLVAEKLETSPDPLTSIIQALELLKLLTDRLKEGKLV